MKIILNGYEIEGSPVEILKLIQENGKNAVASECGVSGLPLFDAPKEKPPVENIVPRRLGQQKLVVTFRNGETKKYHDLHEFYYLEGAEKKRISPCRKMDPKDRVFVIARNIMQFFFEHHNMSVESVMLFRNGQKNYVTGGTMQ